MKHKYLVREMKARRPQNMFTLSEQNNKCCATCIRITCFFLSEDIDLTMM